MNEQVLDLIKLALEKGVDLTDTLIRETLNYFLVINIIDSIGWLIGLGVLFKTLNVGVRYCKSCAATTEKPQEKATNMLYAGLLGAIRNIGCVVLFAYFLISVKPSIKIAVAPKLFLIELVKEHAKEVKGLTK